MDLSKCEQKADGVFDKYFAKLDEFRKESKYYDVNIVIGSKTFPCHRTVLASASSYFDAMLGGHFEESKQKDVKLNGIGATCFENVLEFVYRSKVTIDEKNSYDLLKASRFFDLVDLEEICVRFMEVNPPRKYIFQTCTFAGLTGKTKLYEKCLEYVAENFIELTKDEAFLEVSCDILVAILKHYKFQRVNDVTLNFIIQWKDNNSADKEQVKKLLSHVNVGGISCDYLTKLVVKDDEDGSRLNVQVIGLKSEKYVMEEYTYRNDNQEWTRNKTYSKNICCEKNTVIGNRIFSLSHFDRSAVSIPINEFRMKECNGDDCEILRNPPIAVAKYALSTVHNTVYLYSTDVLRQRVNETNTSARLSNTEKSEQLFSYIYDFDEWFSVPKPNVVTIDSCLVSANNFLYLISGYNYEFAYKRGNNKYAQCYDHRAPNWITLPEMSYDHVEGAACAHNGKLYVLGGRRQSKEFEVFDPIAGRWQMLKHSTYKQGSRCLVSYGGFIWAIGSTIDSPVEMYHATSNVWTESKKLRETQTAGGHATIVIDAFVC